MKNNLYKNFLHKKKFSQNFLQDKHIINTIISFLNLKPNQLVVEIGPGLGNITKSIIKYVNKVIAIEIDKDLVNILNKDNKLNPKIEIINNNILDVDLFSLFMKHKKPLRIIGSLPYNISTSIILNIFKYKNIISDMLFIVQKEVASRLIAIPNTKEYSRLSIITQYHCRVSIVYKEILPRSFFPIPKVKSTLVYLTPHLLIPFPVENLDILSKLTKLAFGQRRKMLRNSLKGIFSSKKLEEYGVCSTYRAENLSIEKYCKLANKLNIVNC